MSAVINSSDLELRRDRDLVELHQAGDDAAFTELYALHYGRLVRFCHRLTRDPHAAEEVAQEAFTRAFGSLERLRGERRFYPWLTVIARRVVIDRVRERRRFEFRAELEAGSSRAAEDVVFDRMDFDHVAMAFGRLAERHQDVLRLRDWEGLSYDAIAERLGVPATTVPPLLHRARLSLRREYLSVTRTRFAAWLHLAPLIAGARRLRDRAAAWTGHLPDPGIFAAPMAGAVLSAGMLLAPQAFIDSQPALSHSAATSLGLNLPQAPSLPGAADSTPWEPTGNRPGDAGSKQIVDAGETMSGAGIRPADTVLGNYMDSDPNTWEERQERRRRMPIYYKNEQTGIFFSADPFVAKPMVERALGL